MLNPFDLRGPEFLLFYLLVGIGVNLLLRWKILGREKESLAALRVCTDPYKLACLRAGVSETLRIVLFSLIDRGLLKAYGPLVKAEPQAVGIVRRPVEQAVATYFFLPAEVGGLFTDPAAVAAGSEFVRELEAEGLFAGDATRIARQNASVTALLILIGVSAIKIMVALSRGRHNIIFLVILTGAMCFWAICTWSRQRTGAGDEVLRRARQRFNQLKERAKSVRPGGMTNDASFLAALFGLTALPSAYFPYVNTLFPQAAASGVGSSSGGCGGSSGGCGGGGCGGCGG